MQSSTRPSATQVIYTDVTRNTISPLSSDISKQISQASFIAIDTEFTGLSLCHASPALGLNTADWNTRATDMREMYKAMANVAKSHALVSLGLSTYTHTSTGMFHVYNFNCILQEQNTHFINPASVSFLAQNGFDLNKQAQLGIRFFSGPNPMPLESRSADINLEGVLMRNVVFEMIRHKKPLVIHNGLFDLVYLYQSFFGPLPDSYESFVFDLTKMFPAGIYDTKFMAEKLELGTASFLAYLYHKNERIQKQRRDQNLKWLFIKQTEIVVKEKPSDAESHKQRSKKNARDVSLSSEKPYCEHFAAFGHCKYNEQCKRSHDIFFILDCQEKEKNDISENLSIDNEANTSSDQANGSTKRKRTDDASPQPSKILKALNSKHIQQSTTNDQETIEGSGNANAPVYHNAACDAFMTGYIFASLQIEHGDAINEFKNKIFRVGRGSEPLLIQASRYSSSSTTYKQTMKIIKDQKRDDCD
ncbi:hypothetical protein IWW36_001936 [Coemansia brasiliensis]|uniref:C3H1-type domain-containing protein n=1 Tax=Coemansia brasiliensis TaxID=2650707 RepID=A0A9W8I879_9FUNG|nr:hypothetical protein IWW36_001936 [Coemansia brasiliensis]